MEIVDDILLCCGARPGALEAVLPLKRPPAAQASQKERFRTIAEHPNSPPASLSEDIEVETCRLTRKAGSCAANAWVRIGDLRILVKVMNGSRGLFIAPPASAYRSSTGKLCYAARVKFVDSDLKDEVEAAVLDSYRKVLDETGRNEPLPYPHRAKEPDRLDKALVAASKNIDPVKAGEELFGRISEILEDSESTFEPWEKSKAMAIFLKLCTLQDKRLFAALRAAGEFARLEVAAMASAPQETTITVAQAVAIAKDALEGQKANAGVR